MEDQSKMSPAIQFLQATWNMATPAKSWLTLNSTMHTALMLAIQSGAVFADGDAQELKTRFRWGYWIGEGGLEKVYTTAIESGNRSAWKMIEAHRQRKPFIIPWAKLGSSKSLPRVCAGAKFEWMGELVEVTSFNDESGHLIACSYHPDEWKIICTACHTGRWVYGKLKHRFTITHADIAAERKRRKAANANA